LVNKISYFYFLLEDKKKDKKGTESYTGGEKSGMMVENPDDIEGIMK